MKKRISAITLTILLFVLSTVGVWASDASESSDESGFSGEYERLTDSAGILSEEEAQTILAKLDEVSERQKFDIVILTVDSLEGSTATEYADDFFDYYGYGYGEEKDGILLLVSMEDRDWALSTHGYGITAFTDAGCDYIADQFKSSLSNGEYETAFEIYIDQCDAFVTQAREYRPYDNSNLPKKPLGIIWIPVALVLGFICAVSIVGGMKRQLKTVTRKTTAGNYQKKGSLKVTESRDLFLYENVTRTAKPKESEQDSGSSTHTSSSGETHGGSSGKF